MPRAEEQPKQRCQPQPRLSSRSLAAHSAVTVRIRVAMECRGISRPSITHLAAGRGAHAAGAQMMKHGLSVRAPHTEQSAAVRQRRRLCAARSSAAQCACMAVLPSSHPAALCLFDLMRGDVDVELIVTESIVAADSVDVCGAEDVADGCHTRCQRVQQLRQRLVRSQSEGGRQRREMIVEARRTGRRRRRICRLR